MYEYPEGSNLAGDGRGGVWLLCKTGSGSDATSRLWHANENRERNMYEYPKDSTLAWDVSYPPAAPRP
eukprot:338954-Prymnesium_polylepis.1